MTFKDALELANNNKNIIGKKLNGATVDDIIIHPVNEKQFEEFLKSYTLSLNAQKAVLPYLDFDLSVSVVLDKHRISKQSVFFHTSIERAINGLDEE